jgi:hypothetical protein
MQALMLSAGAFLSFSGIALFSKRRSFLFLGGIIMTMMMAMSFYSMAGWLFGANPLGIAYSFIGLFMACLWIIFDT